MCNFAHKKDSAYELGNQKLDLFLNQEIPVNKKVQDYINSDHMQPFLSETSPCGWELWPRLQENEADVAIDIEKHLFDLDPFRTLNQEQNNTVQNFVSAFEDAIKQDYLAESNNFLVLTVRIKRSLRIIL